jgi:hypothetical protein
MKCRLLVEKKKREAQKAEKAAKRAAAEKAENAENGKYLDSVESKVYQVDATKAGIMERGEACIESHVQFESIMLNDTQGSLIGGLNAVLSGPASYDNDTVIQGGDVIKKIKPEKGIIIANSRFDFSKKLMTYNVQSKITLMVKEGRFKIKHNNIKELMKSSTGSSGYDRVLKAWGMGWEDTQAELVKLSDTLAKCINKPVAEEEW